VSVSGFDGEVFSNLKSTLHGVVRKLDSPARPFRGGQTFASAAAMDDARLKCRR
jgi:hypothetical protein